MMTFYEELKRLAKAREMTVDGVLAKSIGKNLHTFQGWKQRGTLPRADELFAICKVLEVSMEHFFTENPEEILPKRYKKIVETLDGLSNEEVETLEAMTPEQLKQVCKMYQTMSDK